MIKLLGKIPGKLCVAVSGGADSMAALDFLSKNRDILVLHFNHRTEFADKAEALVVDYCESKGFKYIIGSLTEALPKGCSKEDFWRKQRYNFFNNNNDGRLVVTCHHLDDAVETWIFTSLHGKGRLIPYSRDIFIRPFLLTRKLKMENWCLNKEVPYIEDPSNYDTKYMRNYIRHTLMPSALNVNPGLHKVVSKKLKNSFNKES
jgi:tRNA(Ile)-lysidine synthetase-like protein